MTIVAARRYKSGVCSQEVVVDGDPRQPLSDGQFDWVGAADPTP